MSLITNCNRFKSTSIYGFLNVNDGIDSSDNFVLGQISTQQDVLINNNYILNGLLTVSGLIYNNYYNKNSINSTLTNYYLKNGGTNYFHAGGSIGLVNTSLQQGAYLHWNNSGGIGETNFINSRGGGIGGFNWYNITSNNTISNYIALMTLDNNGNLTVPNINNYCNSSFINSNFYDKNFINSISENLYNNYYDKSYINSNFNTSSNINTTLNNYYTKSYIDTISSNININYYNKSSIDTTLNNYYGKNYINSISGSFSNYYTKSYIDNTFNTSSNINTTLNNYYTKTNIDTTLNNYYLKSYIDTISSNININYYNKSSIDTTLNNYYTKLYIDLIYNTSNIFSNPLLIKTTASNGGEINFINSGNSVETNNVTALINVRPTNIGNTGNAGATYWDFSNFISFRRLTTIGTRANGASEIMRLNDTGIIANVIGNLTGNVIGNLLGNVTGNLVGTNVYTTSLIVVGDAIELGGNQVSSRIDMKTNTGNSDFDVRLLASGGNPGTYGQGNLTVTALTTNISNLNATSITAVNLNVTGPAIFSNPLLIKTTASNGAEINFINSGNSVETNNVTAVINVRPTNVGNTGNAGATYWDFSNFIMFRRNITIGTRANGAIETMTINSEGVTVSSKLLTPVVNSTGSSLNLGVSGTSNVMTVKSDLVVHNTNVSINKTTNAHALDVNGYINSNNLYPNYVLAIGGVAKLNTNTTLTFPMHEYHIITAAVTLTLPDVNTFLGGCGDGAMFCFRNVTHPAYPIEMSFRTQNSSSNDSILYDENNIQQATKAGPNVGFGGRYVKLLYFSGNWYVCK